MADPEELATIRRDMDLNIQVIAKRASRFRAEHRQTRELITRALKQIGDCRKLLERPGYPFEERFLRESVLAQAGRHVRDAELNVTRQEKIIAHLRDEGENTDSATALLSALKAVLLAHREELGALRRGYGIAETPPTLPDERPLTTSDS